MTPSFRAFSYAATLIFAGALARAQTATADASEPTVRLAPEQTDEVLSLLPRWGNIVDLEASSGYKSNVLLSHTQIENSAFLRGSIREILVNHAPDAPNDFGMFLDADRTAYFSSPTMHHEVIALVGGVWNYKSEHFKFSVDANGCYFDQVQDVSDTEVVRVSERLVSRSAKVNPTVRWLPSSWLWLEASAAGTRTIFRNIDAGSQTALDSGPIENNNFAEGTVRLGWKPGTRVEIIASGIERKRVYDHRQAVADDGLPPVDDNGLPLEVPLRFHEQEAELRGDVTWDQAGHWKTKTRASLQRYEDNYSGFFNFRQRKLTQEIEWTSGAWLVTFEGYAKRKDYEVQTLARLFPGFNPPKRTREEFWTQAQIERKLGETWTIYTAYAWQRSHSNDISSSYRMNESLLGVRWSWKK